MNFSLLAHPLTCLFLSQTAFHSISPYSFPVMFYIDLCLAVISRHPSNFFPSFFLSLLLWLCCPDSHLEPSRARNPMQGQFICRKLCSSIGKEKKPLKSLKKLCFGVWGWSMSKSINENLPSNYYLLKTTHHYILLVCKMCSNSIYEL